MSNWLFTKFFSVVVQRVYLPKCPKSCVKWWLYLKVSPIYISFSLKKFTMFKWRIFYLGGKKWEFVICRLIWGLGHRRRLTSLFAQIKLVFGNKIWDNWLWSCWHFRYYLYKFLDLLSFYLKYTGKLYCKPFHRSKANNPFLIYWF